MRRYLATLSLIMASSAASSSFTLAFHVSSTLPISQAAWLHPSAAKRLGRTTLSLTSPPLGSSAIGVSVRHVCIMSSDGGKAVANSPNQIHFAGVKKALIIVDACNVGFQVHLDNGT